MADVALDTVLQHVQELDPTGERFDRVIRATYDQLYDGQRTGRYRWEQLHKTEKTHFGTLVEINVQREFGFDDGLVLDYRIAGEEVDCKFSHTAQWMLPPEAVDRLCLVITASDLHSNFSVGLVRADVAALRIGRNRDAKASLSAEGAQGIRWLHRGATLTPNLLLQVSDEVRTRIMDDRSLSGQGRIDELFRTVLEYPITRIVVATVARQQDYMKRVRGNGGARSRLRPEGIIILGDYEAHRRVARALDVPVPRDGSFVSVRLAPARSGDRATVSLGDGAWRCAEESDPVVHAPLLPETKRS